MELQRAYPEEGLTMSEPQEGLRKMPLLKPGPENLSKVDGWGGKVIYIIGLYTGVVDSQEHGSLLQGWAGVYDRLNEEVR